MYSTVTYTGDGITQVFAVPFPYINASDVQVQVGGIVPTFIFLTSTTIQITPAPASGASVYIFRATGLAAANVVFADGYTLRAADLNAVNTQVLYGLQEAQDQTSTAITAAQTASGNLPSVTVAQNNDVLQVVGGVWTLTTPGSFRTNSGLFPLTTKGDIWTFGASNARLGIGANNTVLVADSTQTTGNKWAFQPVADTSITSGASGIAVGLAASGGLLVSSGLLVRGYRVVAADPGTPSDGDTWYNSTVKAFRSQEGSITIGRTGKVFAATADSSSVANTIVQTAPTGHVVTIPANFLAVGKVFRMRFHGQYGFTGTPTLTIATFKNSTQIEAVTLNATGSRFQGEFIFTLRSSGAGGTYAEGGWIIGEFNSGNITTPLGLTATQAIDTTIQNQFYIAFTWSVANALNTVHLTQTFAEVLD